jgi:hypothetical protein
MLHLHKHKGHSREQECIASKENTSVPTSSGRYRQVLAHSVELPAGGLPHSRWCEHLACAALRCTFAESEYTSCLFLINSNFPLNIVLLRTKKEKKKMRDRSLKAIPALAITTTRNGAIGLGLVPLWREKKVLAEGASSR